MAFRPSEVSLIQIALTVHGSHESSALANQKNLRTLIESNLPLVAELQPDGILFFVHRAVSTFLTSKTELWTSGNQDIIDLRVEPAVAHNLMAVPCLHMLQSTTATVDGDDVDFSYGKHDFTMYAAEYWSEHLSLSQTAFTPIKT